MCEVKNVFYGKSFELTNETNCIEEIKLTVSLKTRATYNNKSSYTIFPVPVFLWSRRFSPKDYVFKGIFPHSHFLCIVALAMTNDP